MGWVGLMTWLQFRCSMVWAAVKAGMNLDLDMDGYVPKEKQEEWKRIYNSLPWKKLEGGK
jgi:hypothetical protein